MSDTDDLEDPTVDLSEEDMAVLLRDMLQRGHKTIHHPPPQPVWNQHLKGIMGADPMSPYRLPNSYLDYKDITEVVNNKPFAAIYPQSYTPVPQYYRDFNITPYFNPSEDEDYARGALTIAGMVELTANNQPWSLRRTEDLQRVYDIATSYLDQIAEYTQTDKSLENYARKMRALVNVVEKAMVRAENRKRGNRPRRRSFLDLFRGMN